MFLNVKDKAFLINHPSRTQQEVVVEGFLSDFSGNWCILSVNGKSSKCRIGMLKRAVPLSTEALCEIKAIKDRAQAVIDNRNFEGQSDHYYLTILSVITWACDFELDEYAKYPNGVTAEKRIPVSPRQLGEALARTLKGEWSEKLNVLFSRSVASEYHLYLHLFVFKNSSKILDYIGKI